ncbi:MAG: DUF4082 domain-containing protein [Nitrospira sp.]|nr:DUF4082 domain-containing protein [Nitrospira sp.]
MIVTRSIGALYLAVMLGFSIYAEPPARAAVIDLTEIGFEFDGSPWTLGWKFTVNSLSTVESLGVYDSDRDGLSVTAQVGLWLATGGDPLVQTTVPSGTAAALDGHFRFAPIAPTLLTPGTEYIVGSYLAEGLATSFFSGNGAVDPRVNVIDARYSAFGSAAFEFPGLTDPGTDGAAYLGGNFQLTPVPLPAAAWLFGSGLAGLLFNARKRFKRSM